MQAAFCSWLVKAISTLKLRLYSLLTVGFTPDCPRAAFFRWGIPLVLKRTGRLESTEADALRFLNQNLPQLSIPKLVDSFAVDGFTYTVMTKLPGRILADMHPETMASDELEVIKDGIIALLKQLWTLSPPNTDTKHVMSSASGHGLLHPVYFKHRLGGPFDSTIDCFESVLLTPFKDIAEKYQSMLAADSVVWVHQDLRMQNILVSEGRVSGVIDWEDSGWLPKSWQLHVLRQVRWGCYDAWVRIWKDGYSFDDEAAEAAYEAATLKGVGICDL